MASAPDPDDAVIDEYLEQRGHEDVQTWDRSYNKKQCPECGGLHDEGAVACAVCGWAP